MSNYASPQGSGYGVSAGYPNIGQLAGPSQYNSNQYQQSQSHGGQIQQGQYQAQMQGQGQGQQYQNNQYQSQNYNTHNGYNSVQQSYSANGQHQAVQGQSPAQGQAQASNGSRYTSQLQAMPPGAEHSIMRQAVAIPERRADEDRTYGPLGRARENIERGMRMDEEVTLDLKSLVVAANDYPTYAAPPGRNGLYTPLQTVREYNLPNALHEQIRHKESVASMGIFEAIDRAWFALDNSLYLWDYNTAGDAGFQRYDSQDSAILCVALAPVKLNVLIEEIQYALIICTQQQATIFGVTKKGNEVEVYSTNLKATLTSPFTKMISTASGRLFALAVDGNIYELEYGVSSGFSIKNPFASSSTTATVKNHTATGWFGGGARSADQQYTRITADPVRGYVFGLKRSGEIDMFDLAPKDGKDGWVQVGTSVRGVLALIKQDGENGHAPSALHTIVHIAPILKEQSAALVLVAISGFGNRYYLEKGHFDKTAQTSAILRRVNDSVQVDGNRDFGENSFHATNVFIGNPSAADHGTQLKVFTASSAWRSCVRENYGPREPNGIPPPADQNDRQEWISGLEMSGKVYTIAELPATSPSYYPAYLKSQSINPIAMSSLVTQTRRQRRHFAILSNTGLRIVELHEPVDALAADLDIDKRQAIPLAAQNFGKVQLAAMGVLIGSADKFQNADLGSALQSIINEGGAPSINVVASNTMFYSHRHEGLVLQLARFLRPIWSIPVVRSTTPPLYTSTASQAELQTVQANLQGLSRYLDEMSYEGGHAYRDNQAVWQLEENSVADLRRLVQQAIEAISFILLLSDYKLPDIINSPKFEQLRQTFARMTWANLLTHPDAREVAKVLVQSLIESQIGQQTSIDTLSEVLQQRCGSFCQTGDVVKYKAEEALRRAEGTRLPGESQQYLEESLVLYRRAAATLSDETVKDVCARYRRLGFVAGSVDLPLYLASERDPDQKAEEYKLDGERPNDARRQQWEQRQFYYSLVVEAIGELHSAHEQAEAKGDATGSKLDACYSRALSSEDELFHYYLYDWIVSRGQQDKLLQTISPYVEGYLKQTTSDIEGRKDLLWKLYVLREERMSAARVCHGLAIQTRELSLQERQYYLSNAIVNAKAASTSDSDDVQFVSSLEETKEVADVQLEVLRALEKRDDADPQSRDHAVQQLKWHLKNLDDLYMNFARPFRLYEAILLIVKTANTALDDVCRAVWEQLVQDAIQHAIEQGSPVDRTVGRTITDLLLRFYPSEAAHADLVIPRIIDVTYGERGAPGWATAAMADGGVGLRELWDALISNHESVDDVEREYYAEELAVVAERWISNRDQIPAAEIDQLARTYILDHEQNTDNERVDATRTRFKQAMAAIGR